MLTVHINQDITEYRPKVAFGLSLRTIASIGAALGCSVAIAALLIGGLGVPSAQVIPLFWVPAAPCALIGFVTPHGMDFEVFLPLWIRHRYGRHRLTYESPDRDPRRARVEDGRRRNATKEDKVYLKLGASRGVELWSPGGDLEI